jgi:hypothetical protein
MKRDIPEPIMNALREHFPKLLQGEIDGDDVYLLMADDKGRPHHIRSRPEGQFKRTRPQADNQ